MPEQFLFTKEKGSLFNVKVWMKLLVKKSTPCYGNENRNRNLKRRNNAMNFFENTRKPRGFGGKLMTKMMNIGHAKLSQWGFSNISVNPDAAVLDVGCGGGANIVAWLGKCGNGQS